MAGDDGEFQPGAVFEKNNEAPGDRAGGQSLVKNPETDKYDSDWLKATWLKAPGLLPVLLDPRGAQAGEAVLVDRELPRQELLGRQRVARAGLFERE
jgi:hypothetical protein